MSNLLKKTFDKTVEDFDQEFCGETVELLIVTLRGVKGAAVLKNGYHQPSVHFVACVNVATKELSTLEGRLEWLISPEEREEKGWLYTFEPYKIHHVRCRKRPAMTLEPYMAEVLNNCYALLDYLDDGVSDSRLEALIDEYSKPVVIKDAIGEFTLNRAYSWFEGSIDFAGNKVRVMLDANQDSEVPPASFSHLKQFTETIESRDGQIRDFIVKDLWETAEDWIDSDEENEEVLTEAYFYNSLFLSELVISEAGELTLYYGDEKEIFAGHAIEVRAMIDGEVESANLVG